MKKFFESLFWYLAIFIAPVVLLSLVLPNQTNIAAAGSDIGLGIGVAIIGAVDMFSTRTLLAAVQYMRQPTTFLLNLFFREIDTVDSDTVDVDILRDGERMAAFVAPVVEGKVVAADGYTTSTFKPAYIKEKMALTPQDLLIRDPGKTIYGPQDSGESRIQKKVARYLKIMMNRIIRREEWMAAQALTTGAVLVEGDGVKRTVDFGMLNTHKVILANNDLWSNALSDPIGRLNTWGTLILDDSGLTMDKVVMSLTAWRAFINHAKVKEVLENRRMVIGDVKPEMMNNGAQKVCDWYDPMCEIWVYQGKYIDGNGARQSLIPAGGVLCGSSGAQTKRAYACIQDMEAGNAVLQYFADSWAVKDPSVQWVRLQSAPLPIPTQIDGFLYGTVL